MAKQRDKHEKRLDTLALETKKQKEALLEQLRKTPIVQVACERAGVGRSTYYAWRTEDREFAESAQKAIDMGALLINDLAESQLIRGIQEGHFTAIIFWLKNHHPGYNDKVRHLHEIVENPITDDLKESIANAIKNIGLGTILKEYDSTLAEYKERQKRENETHKAKVREVLGTSHLKQKKDNGVNINDLLKRGHLKRR